MRRAHGNNRDRIGFGWGRMNAEGETEPGEEN